MASTRKTTTTRSLSADTASAETATQDEPMADATPESEDETAEQSQRPALRKKELIERVVEASGMKKKDVKPIVEATLSVLGAALSDQEPMQLPPLGKIQVSRKKDLTNGELMITRVRRTHAMQNEPTDPLAEAAE